MLVQLPGGGGRAQGDSTAVAPPIAGPPEVIAEALRGFAREGIGHVQLVIDPITTESLEALAPVLEILDRDP